MTVTSTLYTPLVETHFYSTGGYQLSTVYTLQPQTTPFTPKVSTCFILPRAIRCVEAKSEDITSGFTCYGLQFVGETTTSVPTQCLPESYINIWRPFDEFSRLPLNHVTYTTTCQRVSLHKRILTNNFRIKVISQVWLTQALRASAGGQLRVPRMSQRRVETLMHRLGAVPLAGAVSVLRMVASLTGNVQAS